VGSPIPEGIIARKSRTNRSPELKAKVALAAVQGAHTAAQLASLHGVHPVQIAQWKKQLVAGAAGVFATGVKTSGTGRTALEEELFARIGRLDIELEWLKKTVRRRLRCGEPARPRSRIDQRAASVRVARSAAEHGVLRPGFGKRQEYRVSRGGLGCFAVISCTQMRNLWAGCRRMVLRFD